LDGVYEDSPAEAAGLVRGDVILAINGDPIFTQRQARLLVAGTSPGDAVKIVGLRQSDEFEATIIVGERPPEL
jgi:serine protease Do